MTVFRYKSLNDEEVADRIAGRKAAEEIAGLVEEESKKFGQVVWEVLHKICRTHVDCVKARGKRESMIDTEASRFGNQGMPYGEFKNRKIDDVPYERLAWYADQTFTDELRRYLKWRREKANAISRRRFSFEADDE